MSEQDAASNGFVLPEKYSDDILDENGNKMSKRYEFNTEKIHKCIG
jgi:hypothetical protein